MPIRYSFIRHARIEFQPTPLFPNDLIAAARVGIDKLVALLQETVAVQQRQVAPQELAQVNVDTTLQEENIT